jgi:1-acyl-sn-glycerol-3-phosphate acyltransferase
MDIPAMFGYLPVQFRIMAKQILFMVPFLGWHLYMSGNIPINRKDARQAFGSVFKASNLIKRGISLLVFVEGTRSRDGKLHRFKRGSFTLARKLNVPVVPVAIKGSFELMPADAWTAKGGTIEIKIMPPIEISADTEINQVVQDVRRQMVHAGLEDSEATPQAGLD